MLVLKRGRHLKIFIKNVKTISIPEAIILTHDLVIFLFLLTDDEEDGLEVVEEEDEDTETTPATN